MLTKQQKRDLKRAEKRKLEIDSVVGDKSSSRRENRETPKKKRGKCPRNTNTVTPIAGLSVYKRECILPKPLPKLIADIIPKDRLMIPSDQHFDNVIQTCYEGFVRQPPTVFDDEFHSGFYQVLDEMEKKNFFQFDMTQPAGLGTKVARTFVTRCLVGEPGTTYKYLGLRMFSHSWDTGDVGVCESVSRIKYFNDILIDHTKSLLKSCGKKETGSCKYNLTLINRCYERNNSTIKLKDEPLFKKEKCTISWHADSTLEHFSSIAVYHCLKKKEISTEGSVPSFHKERPLENDWRIALRVLHHAEGPTSGKLKKSWNPEDESVNNSSPPVSIPLPDKWSYFLLDDFNHHHQHAVLAGSSDRFASTHRVCRTEGHTFQSIKLRCQNALELPRSSLGHVKNIKGIQSAFSEVEFEWIRQFYIQGKTHYNLHTWWHQPMEELMDFWRAFENMTHDISLVLKDAADGNFEEKMTELTALPLDEQRKLKKKLKKRKMATNCVTSESFDALIDSLIDRQSKRAGWRDRETDTSFHSLDPSCHPMKIPLVSQSKSATSSEVSSPDEEEGIRELETLILEMKRMKTLFNSKISS